MNKRVFVRRYPARDQAIIQSFGRAINKILKEYWRQRTEEAVKEVKRLIGSDPSLHREAWNCMKGWYWAAVDRAPTPNQVTLERIIVERV